ncbi:MAG: ribulose phosphate epimerase [Myxococcales bacterium]|nr:ribulose phosphate epimerase [Myxococcales bacterium]
MAIFSGLLVVPAALVLGGCSGEGGGETAGDTEGMDTDDSGSTTGDMSGTSTSGASDGSTSTSTSTTGETTGDTEGCSFLECTTGGTGDSGAECDNWAQDCPDGEKCMPFANDGGNAWNSLKCSDIDAAPSNPGDACTVEGNGVSGVDSCDSKSMCWDVNPETNEGVCVAFCEGTPENPSCGAGTACAILNDGVLILCLTECDPLLQDCPGDDACLPSEESFICILDASGDNGAYGEPCEYSNACDPGLVCLNSAYVEDCPASGCCSPWCDVSEPNSCPGATQECLAWYEPGTAPPGYENVGVCAIPQ